MKYILFWKLESKKTILEEFKSPSTNIIAFLFLWQIQYCSAVFERVASSGAFQPAGEGAEGKHWEETEGRCHQRGSGGWGGACGPGGHCGAGGGPCKEINYNINLIAINLIFATIKK